MFRIKLFPDDTHIPFMKYRYPAMAISGLLIIASIVLVLTRGLNMGIDFAGGIMLEVGSPQPLAVGDVRSVVAAQDLGAIEVQEFGNSNDFLIRIERQEGDATAQQAAVAQVQEALRAEFGEDLSWRRVEFIGPKVSGELIRDGILAVLFSLGAILVYIWFRFEWHFGLAAVATLAHDVALTIGLFSITGLEFNLSIIAALLTIVGYSLNDTVVVFDRIRENLRKYRKMELAELLDLSINQTMSRTLMTAVTTLIALSALFFLGGTVIQGFTAAMIWGIVVGTYSSVFVASPLLLNFRLKSANVTLEETGKSAP